MAPDELLGQYGWVLLLAASIVVSVVAAKIVLEIIRRYFVRVARRTKSPVDEMLIRAVSYPIYVLVFLTGVNLGVSTYVPFPESMDLLRDTLMALLNALMVVVGGVIAFRVFDVFLTLYASELAKKAEIPMDKTALPTVRNIIKFVLGLLFLIFVLGALGIDITAPLAGLGVIGIIFTIALQDTISKMASGFMIMLDRPFKVGDVIEVKGTTCRVLEIGVRNTKLLQLDTNNVVIMPNSELVKAKVTNFYRPQKTTRVVVSVKVPADQDLEKVKKVLTEIASSAPHVVNDPEPEVMIAEANASEVKLNVVMWLDDYANKEKALDAFYSKLMEEHKAGKISIK